MTTLIDDVHTRYDRTFKRLSPLEYQRWTLWIETVKKSTRRIKEAPPSRTTKRAAKGIRDLKKMDIVVKQADKNLGIVPIRGDIYRTLRSKHLEPPFFNQVNTFPHADILNRLQNILKLGSEVTPMEKEAWIEHAMNATEPCYFYIIPKLHKPKLSTRPITANHSYMLAPLSKRLAVVLQSKVDGLSEIARDSKMVIQQLEELRINEPIEFITYDVETLYPSIDINEAIKTLNREIPEMRKNGAFWTKVLQLIMYNQFVQAGSNTYRQMKGTATGTQVAPPFANLFLYYKFRRILRNPRILYHSRYIDDGLLIVKMNTNSKMLLKCLEISSKHTLTTESSAYKATYLDITVYKGGRYRKYRRLDTKVFFKPTNKFLYLPPQSNHPSAHKTSIIIGESIRCLRISSDKANWLEALRLIFNGLLRRGYSPTTIKKQWKKVRYEDREKYIWNERTQKKPDGVLIMTRYHPSLKGIWKALLEKHPIRSNVFNTVRRGKLNNTHRHILDKWPPILVFKDFTKVSNMVIQAKERDATIQSATRPPAV